MYAQWATQPHRDRGIHDLSCRTPAPVYLAVYWGQYRRRCDDDDDAHNSRMIVHGLSLSPSRHTPVYLAVYWGQYRHAYPSVVQNIQCLSLSLNRPSNSTSSRTHACPHQTYHDPSHYRVTCTSSSRLVPAYLHQTYPHAHPHLLRRG
jgi:hypothetical protein